VQGGMTKTKALQLLIVSGLRAEARRQQRSAKPQSAAA